MDKYIRLHNSQRSILVSIHPLFLLYRHIYFTPTKVSIFSKGQNFVKELCSRFTPTNTASQIQLIFTVFVNIILIITKLPAIALTILSFILLFLKV